MSHQNLEIISCIMAHHSLLLDIKLEPLISINLIESDPYRISFLPNLWMTQQEMETELTISLARIF